MPRLASTLRSATSPLRRLVAAGVVGLACGLGATPAAAVIILGSSAGNTSSPTDPGLATPAATASIRSRARSLAAASVSHSTTCPAARSAGSATERYSG